jgi:threonine dehydratase
MVSIKQLQQPATVLVLAAIMGTAGQELKGLKVVLLLCGGNIDPTVLHRVIDHGLAVDGRLWRFTVTVSDRPGGMARLTEVIANAGASVLEINHDRAFSGPEVFSTTVEVTVETADHDHINALNKQLHEAGFGVVPATGCH